jgi:hypothetical protein
MAPLPSPTPGCWPADCTDCQALRTALTAKQGSALSKYGVVTTFPTASRRPVGGRRPEMPGAPPGGRKVLFDASPPDGGPGILLAFVDGPESLRLGVLPAEERRQAVLGSLARFVESRELQLEPVAFLERDWTAEEWTRGCYAAHLPPGAWTQVGQALREPVGRIHWAGTETAVHWCGCIDAAISSEERAAQEVLAARQPGEDGCYDGGLRPGGHPGPARR